MLSKQLTTRRSAFTLIEILIVISLIILLAAVSIPTITTLFGSGSAAQAYNMLAAQITTARAMAIRNSTYAGVHVQMDVTDPNVCWASIVTYDSASGTFSIPEDIFPHQMPGNMAFGEIASPFVAGSAYQATAMDDNSLDDFTSFTIVFDPSGKLVRRVNDNPVNFDLLHPAFATGDTQIWDPVNVNGENGVAAVTIFEYSALKARTDTQKRADFLDESGQFLAVNVYSGQLLSRR